MLKIAVSDEIRRVAFDLSVADFQNRLSSMGVVVGRDVAGFLVEASFLSGVKEFLSSGRAAWKSALDGVKDASILASIKGLHSVEQVRAFIKKHPKLMLAVLGAILIGQLVFPDAQDILEHFGDLARLVPPGSEPIRDFVRENDRYVMVMGPARCGTNQMVRNIIKTAVARDLRDMMEDWAKTNFGKDVGLNADWAVSAWFIKGQNLKDGIYLVDNEDDTYSLVHRVWHGDDSETKDMFTGNASQMRHELRSRGLARK